jgi:hypothetical protein
VNGEALPDARYIVSDATLLRAESHRSGCADGFSAAQTVFLRPDLRFTNGHSDPRSVVFVLISRLILEHAPEVLQPGNAEVLRANATNDLQHWESTTAMWMAAANALQAVQDHAKGVAQMKADFAKFPAIDS